MPGKLKLTKEEKLLIRPFFTNLTRPVYCILFLGPEITGALCSRASRSKDDLRVIFLKEFVKPFLKTSYGKKFKKFSNFLQKINYQRIFLNPRARKFYAKWLAQYGDDSILQMAGTHIVFNSISQIAIKHFENQRIGISAIERSTRYVLLEENLNKRLYYIPEELKNEKPKYIEVMDEIFKTYRKISEVYFNWLKEKFNEKEIVLKTKVLDVTRAILPLSLLSQVAFYGNGQALEYLILRSLHHKLSEIRNLGRLAYKELLKVIPSFLRRIEKNEDYMEYLSKRETILRKVLKKIEWKKDSIKLNENVRLIEYDKFAQEKIIASLIYPLVKEPFERIFEKVKRMKIKEKEKILESILSSRKFRWYKVPRAFESAFLRFEIISSIGAWRDLQRHRMQTQFNEKFHIYNGYEIPEEIKEIKMDSTFMRAIEKLEELYRILEKKDQDIAQYSVSFAHKIRFIQYQNLREFFWETELRTTPQGHPEYRLIEQEKAKIILRLFPLIGKYLLVDFNKYEFPRRGQDEVIKKKIKEILKHG